jgi:hypothetical protein
VSLETSKQRACDLIKQVLLIHEPFTAQELVELVVTSPPTTRDWIRAMEGEGLLQECGRVKVSSGQWVPTYRRAGALAAQNKESRTTGR